MIRAGVVVFGRRLHAAQPDRHAGRLLRRVLVIAAGSEPLRLLPAERCPGPLVRAHARARAVDRWSGPRRRRHRRAAGGLVDADLRLAHHGLRLRRARDPHRLAAGTWSSAANPTTSARPSTDCLRPRAEHSGLPTPKSPSTRDFTAREALRTQRLLAAVARPRLRPARRARGQGARHHAPEGRPRLLARTGIAGHHADDRVARSAGMLLRLGDRRPLRQALCRRGLHAGARARPADADLRHRTC